MPQNFRIDISYDGTDYSGWQRQPDKKTIQGFLEESLAKITSKHIPIIGAGRTDAGVHAWGQVAHFKARVKLGEGELIQAFNGLLPKDIRVTSLRKVSSDFHARKSARSKVYQYRIVNSPVISPFMIRYALHWPSVLDLHQMKEAAALFVREADFTPFSSNRFLHPVRTVTRSEIKWKGREIFYTVEANGFLRYMVRGIVGTLLEVGKGKVPPDKIEELFQQKQRTLSSPTAPALGLCLLKVNY
ncbi:MAG: tRNA pseudouridine(38-40) synthase TruA [Candidatus Aminicenantes bacterium]|jgi:tRNA pseudouridine38-40 synthase